MIFVRKSGLEFLQKESIFINIPRCSFSNRGRESVLKAVSKLKNEYTKYMNIFRLQSSNLSAETSRILNQLTGYEECERLRTAVVAADQHFQQVKDEFRKSRSAFDKAMQSRSQCQKELNALLQRKQAWADEDLMRFTELYRKEMRLETAESEARETNEKLDTEVDRAHQSLMDTLRERYQEEQLWSDKIRRISTFGTFSLMGLNLLLFLLIQLYIEPKKRRNFITNFEDVIVQRLDGVKDELLAHLPSPTADMVYSSLPSNPPKDLPFGYIQSFGDAAKGAAVGAVGILMCQFIGRSIFSS